MENSVKFGRAVLVCLGLILVSIALCAAPAGAATLTVNTTDDHDNGACNLADCTLREAIKYAGSGDTVEFDLDGTFYLNHVDGELVINKNLTIKGRNTNYTQAKTVISGYDNYRVFNITSGKVAIKNLYITAGAGGSSSGGGIRNEGELILDTVRISGCSTDVAGGAVFTSGDITINNCFIAGNVSGANGGGVYVRYGDDENDRSTATVTDSYLNGNVAGSDGGAFYVAYSDLYVTRSTISNNDATLGWGGGVFAWNTNFYFTDSTLESNTAYEIGGGIAAQLFSDLHISGSTIAANEAGTHGGGIDSFNSNLVARNSTIYGNKADRNGGGINITTGSTATGELTYCTITENWADADCGDAGGTCWNGDGGGIYLSGDYFEMRGVILSRNVDHSSASPIHPNCHFTTATFVSAGYNLVGNYGGCEDAFPPGTPNLNSDYVTGASVYYVDSLADNGGPTETCRPLLEQYIVNLGPPDGTDADGVPVRTDQRGMGRVRGGAADIGAYEVQAASGSTLGLLLE